MNWLFYVPIMSQPATLEATRRVEKATHLQTTSKPRSLPRRDARETLTKQLSFVSGTFRREEQGFTRLLCYCVSLNKSEVETSTSATGFY